MAHSEYQGQHFRTLVSTRLPSDSELEGPIEDIQSSMLAAMSDATDNASARMVQRIEYADDIQALWYMRSDLMAIVARKHGEAAAREKLEGITRMFKTVLPQALKTRASRLS